MVGNRQGDDGGRPARWEILGRTEEASCRVFSVIRKHCRHPIRGREDDFYVLESSDWVNTIAVTPVGRMVLVEQYRFGSEDLSLEVPGGLMDLGEEPIEAAERELREETGFVGRHSRLLGSVRPNPAIQSNRCHIVLIEEAERLVDTDWDENEELTVELPTVAEVFDMAHTGKITHALALNALFLYHPIWLASRPGDLT
jgi:8-oxo-dGTP pyrophosphatase MutT (NUDIX family)